MLTGGGTLGSVTPLLGVYEAWKKMDPEQAFVWIGTPGGPETELVAEIGIPFDVILVPKAYRYLTWRWFAFPFFFLWSFFEAGFLLARYRPCWILSAGAYVSVPLAWLAPLFGARVALHQLDYELGMSNRLMAPVASLVTSTFSVTKKQLPRKRVEVVGALVYGGHLKSSTREMAIEHFDLDAHKSTILVLGGGIGSLALNRVFERWAEPLASEFNVLHATGSGKRVFQSRRPPDHYYVTELFVDDFGQALHLADLVVTRAGLGTLIELVQGKKATIFVPLPNSPQEENARAVAEAHAGIVLEQGRLETDLLKTIHEALEPHRKRRLEEAIGKLFPVDGATRIVDLIKQKNTPE